MRNVYLPPFRAAVDAGVATVMAAFNDVNGVPMTSNRHMLRDVLREDWGFRGFVVSDWGTINELVVNGTAADRRAAARAAAEAGVNLEMTFQCYHKYLADLVESGESPPRRSTIWSEKSSG